MKELKTKVDIVFKLLQSDWATLEEKELEDILEYILDLPEYDLEKQKHLRKRIFKVLSKYTSLIPKHMEERIRDFLIRVTIIDAQKDFYTYVKLVAGVVIPNTFRDGRHIQVICEDLQSLFESYEVNQADFIKHLDGEILEKEIRPTERLQVFLPPRSMKSVLCSILYPSWVLGRNPAYRILLIGGSVSVAEDEFGRPLSNLIKSEEYRDIFPNTVVDPKVQSAQRFKTTKGGGFFCGGGSTGMAGRGGDFIICDDVINEQNAYSKVERTKINHKYVPGYRSRAQPGAAELIINTRWHLDDLSGFTQRMDGFIKIDGTLSKKKCYRPWKIITIPAILDAAAVETLSRPGDNKDFFKEGDSYWPEHKSVRELESLKHNYAITEPHKWNALYMQNPVPEEGNIVKHTDWKVWRGPKPPKVTQVIVSMDTAYSEKERADFSAYTVWGIFENKIEGVNGIQYIPTMILLDAQKGKWDFPTLCDRCEELRSHPQYKPDYFVIEKKASGITLAQELHRRGFPLIEYDPRGKKSERLQAAAALMRAGRVWVPEDKEWAQEVIDETCNFPSAPNDDLADTVSMAVIWMRDNGIIRHEGYDYFDEDEEDDKYVELGSTYWSTLVRGH